MSTPTVNDTSNKAAIRSLSPHVVISKSPILKAVTRACVIVPEWRHVALSLGLGVTLLSVVFNNEILAAVKTWAASTAYNHCFLIIPIALYLLWDRRSDFVGIAPQPMPIMLLLGVPLALLWLVSERLGIMEGRQLVALSFIELLFLAVLGRHMWWGMAGPLLYLYFLVPFGEFLTPRLQDITTWFIRHGLETVGVPAFIDGYIIEIPQGTFLVAEACAGLRFLIASIAFGCLYALMMYRGPVRRALFIIASVIVPVIANGVRGFGIVYLGYLLDSAQAAAADHIIYGWVFFSLVIMLLIALGLPFRQDQIVARAVTLCDGAKASPSSMRAALAVALGVAGIAAITPAIATSLTGVTPAQIASPSMIDAGAGCAGPARDDMSGLRTMRVVCDGVAMDISWRAFSPRITAAPLMSERRRLVSRAASEGLQENWLEIADGTPSPWRIMVSTEPAFAIGVSIWIDGRPIRPGLAMRARMALNSVLGSDFMPMLVTVTPAVTWDTLNLIQRREAALSVSAFLLLHSDLDRTIGLMSRL